MIDPTAVILGPQAIAASSYVGPYCVVGFPANLVLPAHLDPTEADGRPSSRGATLGPGTQLLSHVVIGEGTALGADVWCDHHTRVGCNTKIGDGAQLMYGVRVYDRVSVGERAWVGGFVCNDAVIEAESVVLGQLVHKFVNASEGTPERAPVIRKGAFVGMNALVIGGIEVGTGAYVAAGAVLTRSAQPGRLYVGAPARDVGRAPNVFANQKES